MNNTLIKYNSFPINPNSLVVLAAHQKSVVILLLFCSRIGLTREIAGLTGRGESENETAEITPDLDIESGDQLHKHGGSFKRPGPVMGNRSLETRNSKRSQSNPHQQQHQQKQQSQTRKDSNMVPSSNNPSSPITINSAHVAPALPAVLVGALEVENVKCAINRYGTLPKGARIGAYLDSLRQSTDNATGNNASSRPLIKETIALSEPLVELPPPSPAASALNNNSLGHSMSPRLVVKSQPQMIRSNSSGGVTMTNSTTQSLNKLQRHRTTTDGSMITFSSFRGTSGSPKRAHNPTLADLEFPPPPVDLPPPPEEFESSADIETTSTRSTLDTMQLSQSASLAPSTDVSNTEPSVEEASSRFGVSLRKREPSTDSCSSLGSPATGNPNDISVENNLCNSNDKTKSMSELNGKPTENSLKKNIVNDVPNNRTTNSNSNHHTRPERNVDHISQLVNELAESMNLPKGISADLAKKTSPSSSAAATAVPTSKIESNGLTTNANNFKAQLKKVDPKKIYHATSKEEPTNPIVDFKSRLRRVDNSNENEPADATLECKKIVDANDNSRNQAHQLAADEHDSEHSNSFRKNSIKMLKKNGDHDKKKSPSDPVDPQKKTDAKQLGDNEKTKALAADANETEDDDDKRKSTGSISSLKKLWESNNTSGGSTNEPGFSQVSPKSQTKSVIGSNNNNNNKISGGSGDDYDDHILTANKKPAVPTKPTKLSSIYATPIQVKLNADSTAVPTPSASPMPIKRETILELIQLLETSLKSPSTTITASQWLQLSDKLNILQNSCVSYADSSTMALHSKFQFRELVTRIEAQSRSLRSAGSKNVQDNEKLIQEVGQTLKQITNTLHR